MKSNDLQHPVLVVDDEADIRDLMEMTLMKMGLRVDTATGVEDAKNKLEGGDYSLVLTDMRMPTAPASKSSSTSTASPSTPPSPSSPPSATPTRP